MKILKDIVNVLFRGARKRYKETRISRLKNMRPTIISNNCVGGIMYHDLGLQFRSPTINLWFENDDYFEFVNNLEFYIHSKPEQIFVDGIDYPVGQIKRGDKSIKIYFMHYDSFEEASQKWVERAGRVDFENLFIFFNCSQPITAESDLVKCFLALKAENKVMLANRKAMEGLYKEIVHMPVYNRTGKNILDNKNKFIQSRYLDDFDYVSFLNNGIN